MRCTSTACDGGPLDGALKTAIERDFGSLERWQAEFTAMGKALGGGSGWVLLTYSPRDGRLVNQWASDHAHTLAGGTPVLALDMYEHSYHMDYGARRQLMRRVHAEHPLATGGHSLRGCRAGLTEAGAPC
jgi:superoxide dismutase